MNKKDSNKALIACGIIVMSIAPVLVAASKDNNNALTIVLSIVAVLVGGAIVGIAVVYARKQ